MRRRIHIVGLGPRTGTTLMAECMAACFKIDAVEEHEMTLLARRQAKIYLTKAPHELPLVGPRLRVDPRFFVICMVRDPRDVIVSRHGRNMDRYWAPLFIWRNQVKWLRALKTHKRFLAVQYEEFVRDPDAVQARIEAWLPFLQRKAKFSEFHEVAAPSDKSTLALGGLREIGPESVGRWREHLPRVAGQLRMHGGISKQLIELGYETDDSWRKLLDGVKPDRSNSKLGEKPKRTEEEFRRWRRTTAYRDAARGLAEYLLHLRSV